MSEGQIRAQVLVVDDETDHAEAMAEALRKPGHVCTIVHSFAAAKDELLHGHFDVVVTDLVMETETAGLDVLATARAEGDTSVPEELRQYEARTPEGKRQRHQIPSPESGSGPPTTVSWCRAPGSAPPRWVDG